jgi:hypothetical protein
MLSRDELKKVLGGAGNCTCTYGDNSQVDNDCDDDQTVAECCGPAAKQKACIPQT